MSSYLLLRNNKESGPFSLQQLLHLGLKPYDLVWAEGKSAAWRYPSEVEELKEYAPVVEEQPFDRFYKKPGEEKHHFEEVIERKPEVKKETVQPTIKTGGKVFVSLPGKRQVITEPPKPKFIAETKPTIYERLSPEPMIEKNELKEEYSQPLDEIKKMYAETYLRRKKKISRKKELGNILKIAGGLAFVSFIAIIVYKNIFTSEKNERPVSAVTAPTQQPADAESLSQEENTNPVLETEKSYTPQEETYQAPPSDKTEARTEKSKHSESKNIGAIDANKTKAPEKVNNPRTLVIDENAAKQRTVTDAMSGERRKSKRTETFSANDIAAENDNNGQIQKQEDAVSAVKKTNPVSLATVKANEYRRRAFGGIMDLQLTVNNKSNFILDKVVVQVQYLKPSNEPIKTEKINFTTIAPNSSQTLKLPDFLRGVNVEYKVIRVESSQFDKQLAGL